MPAKPIARRRVRASKTVRRQDIVPGVEPEIEEAPGADADSGGDKRDAYGRYLSDLSRLNASLLTPKEELALGRSLKAHALKAVDNMLIDLETAAAILRAMRCIAGLNPEGLKGRKLRKSLIKRMCSTEADELFEMYAEEEGKRLRKKFIEANLALTISMARKYDTGSLSFPELVQEGNVGLLHAVLMYDYRRGFRFSTYAGWWIRHAIGRAIADKGRTIRIPVHMTEFSALVHKARLELTSELGRTPDDEEVVKRLRRAEKSKRVPETDYGESLLEKVRKLGLQPRQQSSLDQPLRTDDGDGDTMHDVLLPRESEEPPVWASLAPEAVFVKLRHAMSRLSPIELDVLRLRFGFDGDEERTFKEIGEKYRLSRERIRQIQNVALKKLKTDKQFVPVLREMFP